VTICFSKGLGGPMGAVLAGSAALIERAWESKFLFGGALRQSGVIAAAALYALDHHVERLADDHARARRLASALGLDAGQVETNFVAIEDPGDGIARAAAHGVAISDLRPGWLRAVTHLDVTDEDVDTACEQLRHALGGPRPVTAAALGFAASPGNALPLAEEAVGGSVALEGGEPAHRT
jgi:threonine aldolase